MLESFNSQPLVSVIITTYNEPYIYIQQSIDSIINQTYKNLEIILINDNPDRNDLDKILKYYQNSDERIIYLKNTTNKGLVYSLNKALSISSGKLVARMDADDISEKDRLEKQYKFLVKNNCNLVGCNISKIDENGNFISNLKLPYYMEDIKKYIKWGDCVLHPTWLGYKYMYNFLNGYRNIDSCEDYDFILRAILNGFVLGNLPESKVKYRIRNDSISAVNNVRQKIISYYLIKEYLNGNIAEINEIKQFINSDTFETERKKLSSYYENKNNILRCNSVITNIKSILLILSNKYFYRNFLEHLMKLKRERL